MGMRGRWMALLLGLAAGGALADASPDTGWLVFGEWGGDLIRDGRVLPDYGGRCSTFGGAADSSLADSARVALPCGPDGEHTLAVDLDPEDYYCAMRWDYEQAGVATRWDGKRWWANRAVLVVNPGTGASVVVRAVDWGPNLGTGRVIDLSPAAARDLGVRTDDLVVIRFADEEMALGPIAIERRTAVAQDRTSSPESRRAPAAERLSEDEIRPPDFVDP
jgi:hypothetical protein